MPVCYRHPDRETHVRCTRCERPICPDDMVPAPVGFQCPDDARAGARDVRRARTTYGGRLTGGRPTATLVLIGLNALVFLATAVGGTSVGFSGGASPLYAALALQPVTLLDPDAGLVPGVADGQYWRLLTATFLHFGLAHVVLNMLALFQIGSELEAALGRVRFVALYLLSGLAGTAASYAFGPVDSRAAGASGAVFGLFAAVYLVERRRDRGAEAQYAALIGINLVLTFTIPFIDVRGHLGGLVGGALVGLALVLAPRSHRSLAQAVGCGLVAVAVATVVVLRTLALTAGAA